MSLKTGDYVKVTCAAGNEDVKSVHNISLLFAAAGADCIDIAGNPAIVAAARAGAEKGVRLAAVRGMPCAMPVICVSVGLASDQHMRKARVTQAGTGLTALTRACPTGAIVGGNGEPVRVLEQKCIGCGDCALVDAAAIEFYTPKRDLTALIPACIKEGAGMVELHANAGNDDEVVREWKAIAEMLPDGFVSLSLDRGRLSDEQVLARIEKVKAITGERTIVQADGKPMAGGAETVNCTLQAVAMGDIIAKMKEPPFILLSGGTNTKTAELARLAGVPASGIAFGSNARKLVQKQVALDNLESAGAELEEGIIIARGFVDRVKKDLQAARSTKK